MWETCQDDVRRILDAADRPLSVNDMAQGSAWARQTIAEAVRLLRHRGVVRVVGTGGSNKREKLYEKVR